MAASHESSSLRLPLLSDLPKRSASDASSLDGSAHATIEVGPYHILVVHKGPSRRQLRLSTLTMTLVAALCLLLLVYRSADAQAKDRIAEVFQLPTARPGRFDDMTLLRRMRAARHRDPPRMMTLVRPDPAAEEAAARALEHSRKIAELEWKRQWEDMTPAERKAHGEARAANWKREWEAMSAEERLKHTEGQAADWKRQWESLTPAQQAQQRRKWKQDWERKKAAADRESKKAAAKQ